MNVVDHLLDILTGLFTHYCLFTFSPSAVCLLFFVYFFHSGNEHRKTSKYIEEMKALRKEDELLDNAFKEVTEIGESQDDETDKKTDIDFSSLK